MGLDEQRFGDTLSVVWGPWCGFPSTECLELPSSDPLFMRKFQDPGRWHRLANKCSPTHT